MRTFMLVITFIALIDAIVILYMINTICPDQQIAMNIFFGIITAFIVWIIAFQVQELRAGSR